MAVVVSFLGKVDFKDLAKAEKQLAGFRKNSEQTGTSFADIGKKALALGAAFGVGVAGVQGLVNVFKDSIAEAQEAIKVNAATAQIIKATGSAANVTADQVADLSQKISEQIAVDDELIQTSANLILTFKNVANQGEGLEAIFDRTVLAAQDLAAAGFGDAESAAKMLGKALNDPKLGLTALSRAGVTFTEQQKEQIKTLIEGGDVLTAQKLILAEVESQVGGVAGATATGIDKFNVYFDNLKEELGLAILPLINALISGLIPAIKALSDGVKNTSTFIQQNKTAIILLTIAVGTFTAALVIQRAALTASSIAFAANVAMSKLLVGALNLSTTAIVAMSTAMKLIPFVAIATAAAAFVMVLNDGAKAHKEYITETEKNLRATNKLRDANGNFTKEAIALGIATRGSRNSFKDQADAISGTAAAAIDAGNAMGGTLTPNTYDAGDAAGYAAKSYLDLFESIWNAKRIASDFANTSGTVTSALSEGVRLGASSVWAELPGKYGAIDKAARGAAGGASAAGSAISKSAEDAKAAVANYKESFKGVREYLNEAVEEIKIKMADMATSVSSSLMRGFQLGETAEEFGEDGARVGGTFMEKLQAQANKVTEFANKIKELMSLGLGINSPLMQAVIAEGAGSGTAIAQSLIDSGAEGINQATGMLTAAQGAADEIGTLAATNFYGAGLESAQQTVQAFVDRFGVGGKGRERLMTLMDNLAAAMNRSATITVTTVNRVVNETVGAGSAGKTIVGATGGIVNRPTFALIGEAGPEAVIPLSQSRGNDPLPMIGGGRSNAGTTINLTVNAGMGTQGAEVGRQIVDALKAYERRNGSVYVAA